MRRQQMFIRALALVSLCSGTVFASEFLKFEKIKIGDATYEACSVCDVNQDGKPDIVSGEYWFEGPDFKKSHKI
jgi:hypothetical protein